MWHTCRRTALRGPLAATQTHSPRSRRASSYPFRWPAPFSADAHFVVELASCRGVSWPCLALFGRRPRARWSQMVKTMEELVKGSSLVTTFTIPERAPRVHTNCWPPHPGGAGTATACCGAFV